jgi:putative tricarboxylic transport membrane protein
MAPAWLRATHNAVEIGVAVVLVATSAVILNEALRLGPGWGEQGPQPGFFPFVLTVAILIGAVSVVYQAIARPDRRPFFEVSQEIEDLLRVGLPIAIAVAAIRWAGLYVTSGVYLAFFMAWYGRFRWWQAVAGGILLPVVLWLVLRKGFAIPMPMSALYRSGYLPF